MAARSDPQTPQDAAEILRRGRICAIPTETVYGLAADAAITEAVLAVYETKGRPRFNPLISHCTDLAMVRRFADLPPFAQQLAEVFWPGPLTLVVPRKAESPISDIVLAGLDSIALRVPAHPVAQAVIAALGRPVAAPSANPSGKLSPTRAAHVHHAFGGAVPVLDGGPCRAGMESTILTVNEDRATQLRAGAIPVRDIEAVLGFALHRAQSGSAVAAPGMLASHYAPAASLRLDAAMAQPGEVYLGFGEREGALNLSPSGDLREAAANLFAYLAQLDAQGAGTIAVAPIPSAGLGEAINDRLVRAAAPR